MEHDNSELDVQRIGQLTPNPDRHDLIVFEDQESGYVHEFSELTPDTEDPEKLKFRMKLRDTAGDLFDGVEGWIENKRITESRDVKIWIKEHEKGIKAGAGAATVLTVVMGSLAIRHRKRR